MPAEKLEQMSTEHDQLGDQIKGRAAQAKLTSQGAVYPAL